MRYARIRKMDVSNGEGVGISLFVQGCHFHCKGCFNQETWDFNGGKEWTPEVEEQFIQLANKPYIKRISILGGEPLADENVRDVYYLITQLKSRYPEKKIWLYTGYEWEKIVEESHTIRVENGDYLSNLYRYGAIVFADIVVDGKFQLDKQDLYNDNIVFAGSTNQRVIDSGASLSNSRIILHNGEKHGNQS